MTTHEFLPTTFDEHVKELHPPESAGRDWRKARCSCGWAEVFEYPTVYSYEVYRRHIRMMNKEGGVDCDCQFAGFDFNLWERPIARCSCGWHKQLQRIDQVYTTWMGHMRAKEEKSSNQRAQNQNRKNGNGKPQSHHPHRRWDWFGGGTWGGGAGAADVDKVAADVIGSNYYSARKDVHETDSESTVGGDRPD